MAELLKGKPVADAMKAELIKKVEDGTEARHYPSWSTPG